MKKDEIGALYYTIGWIHSRYFLSDNINEKHYIAHLFINMREGYGITESISLNQVIEDYKNGKEQI